MLRPGRDRHRGRPADRGGERGGVGDVEPFLPEDAAARIDDALVGRLPGDPLLRIACALVLLAPCIDYVVPFTRLGGGDAARLLAATPLLLAAQVVLLPIALRLLLDERAAELVRVEPFLRAFVWLIAMPLMLATLVRQARKRWRPDAPAWVLLDLLPVPATAFVLILVLASVAPRIEAAGATVLAAVPVYVIYALVAPAIGALVGRTARLDVAATRAVALSAATRNSLVLLPIAFAVPDGVPLVPAVVVTQTTIELAAEVVYVRFLPRLVR